MTRPFSEPLATRRTLLEAMHHDVPLELGRGAFIVRIKIFHNKWYIFDVWVLPTKLVSSKLFIAKHLSLHLIWLFEEEKAKKI